MPIVKQPCQHDFHGQQKVGASAEVGGGFLQFFRRRVKPLSAERRQALGFRSAEN
jgi:hypothetical protein